MKHPFESYGFYKISLVSKYIIRTKVKMKDPVDIVALRKAVNIATRRYPYFMVKVEIDPEGSYVLVPNDHDIAVVPTSEKNPDLCTEEVGFHLLYVDCAEKDIYFNISHALAGGRGMSPWLMTCVYQYIVEKYGVEPYAPAIRKPDSPLLEGETAEPTLEMTQDSERFDLQRFKGGKILALDYVNGLINPFLSSNEYFEIEFNQKDIMKYSKSSDNSVLTLFEVLMFKTLAKVYPKVNKFIGECAHNPSKDLGIPNTHNNLISHVLFQFTRNMLDWDMEKLGTVARGSMYLQIDPLYSRNEVYRNIKLANEIDTVKGYKEKHRYEKKHSPTFKDGAVHGTFIVNYSGYMDWGEVADYMDGYYLIVDGHQMLELSAYGDKIFCCFMQVIRTDKYINAFKQVLDELQIPYSIRGPFKKGLVAHRIK